MKTNNLITTIYLLGALFFFSSFYPTKSNTALESETGNTLTVMITNIRNNKGRLQLDLYKNQAEYEARMSDDKRRAYVYKSSVSNGILKHTYTNVPDGVYGIALFDDENKNGEIDYGWILPKEGFAFGDYYHMKLTAPKFDNFKFTLKENKTVTMIVRYL